MTSFWGVSGSANDSTDSSEPWNVEKHPNQQFQRPVTVEDASRSHLTMFGQKHLRNQFMNHWNGLDRGLDMRQPSTFCGQRTAAKRHRDMPGDGEPITKRLLSERMAAGMRKLQITDDVSTPNFSNDSWKHDIDDRFDIESDESGCEEDQPQLIIEQDFLNAFKEQSAPSSLPSQILNNIRESNMQLVLWKPVPFAELCKDKTTEEDTSKKTADSKPNTADDNMADSPVDEDMDL